MDNVDVVREKIVRYKQYLEKCNPSTTDENKLLHIFRKFSRMPMTLEHLQETGVGKCVNKLRKVEGSVGEAARSLVTHWKELVTSSHKTVGAGGRSLSHDRRFMDAGVLPVIATADGRGEPDDGTARVKIEEEEREDEGRTKGRSDRRKGERERRGDRERRGEREREREADIKMERNADRKGDKTRVWDESREHSPDREVERSEIDGGGRAARGGCDPDSGGDGGRDLTGAGETEGQRDANRRHRKHHKGKGRRHNTEGHENNVATRRLSCSDPVASRQGEGRSHGNRVVDHDMSPSPAESSRDWEKETADSGADGDGSEVTTVSRPEAPGKPQSEKHERRRHKLLSHHGAEAKAPKTTERKEKRTEVDGAMTTEEEDSEDNGMSFADLMNYDATPVARLVTQSKRRAAGGEGKVTTGGQSAGKRRKRRKDDKGQGRDADRKRGTTHDRSKSDDRSKRQKRGEGQDGSKREKREEGQDGSKREKREEGQDGSKREKREATKPVEEFVVPLPSKVTMTHQDIIDTLPEINTNYRPLPQFRPSSPKNKGGCNADISLKVYSRTQVYSGRRQTTLTAVPTLYNACMKTLIDNIDRLEYVGGVPYDILKPVLERCTSKQLYSLEEDNPQFIGDTNELWEILSKRDFKASEPAEFESWRELYLRKHDERDEKLKHLTANISASIASAKPVRKTQLAYVDVMVKPPRDVRRNQERHGTAGPTRPRPGPAGRGGLPRAPAPSPVIQRSKVVKKVAPMMARSLKLFKNCRM